MKFEKLGNFAKVADWPPEWAAIYELDVHAVVSLASGTDTLW